MKYKLSTLLISCFLTACSVAPVAPVVVLPHPVQIPPLPPLTAQEREVMGRHYLARMQDFLQGKLPQQTP